jgi:uncharacterized DUF497 family protein
VRFDWNARKAAANQRRRGVSFDEAESVFLDSLSATGDDPDHSLDEMRFVTFGVSFLGRWLAVAYVTARRATRAERGSMRKTKTVAADELRSEYKRSDFGALVRGKYTDQLRTSSNVIVIAPEVTELFPNAAAVNAALRSLAEIAKRARSRRGRSR